MCFFFFSSLVSLVLFGEMSLQCSDFHPVGQMGAPSLVLTSPSASEVSYGPLEPTVCVVLENGILVEALVVPSKED